MTELEGQLPEEPDWPPFTPPREMWPSDDFFKVLGRHVWLISVTEHYKMVPSLYPIWVYEVEVNDGPLYIRIGPGKEYGPTARRLQKGDRQQVYDVAAGDGFQWLRISSPDADPLWIHGKYADKIT